jgi:The GLUG motif
VGENDRCRVYHGPDQSYGSITASYSTGAVNGGQEVGGLVGYNHEAYIVDCYSTGEVDGNQEVGGLVGVNYEAYTETSFWDMETSGQITSSGGTGLTTSEMQDVETFMTVGWDFVGQPDGPHDIWVEPEGGGYPAFSWQFPPEYGLPVFTGGRGEPNDPYLISTAEELNSIGHNPRLMKSHFALSDDLDLMDCSFYAIGSADYPYQGVFAGCGHTVSNLMTKGESPRGLFSFLGDGGEVIDLGVVDVNIIGSSWNVAGGLVVYNGGSITSCYSTGTVRAGVYVGGLVGNNVGGVSRSHSTVTVRGDYGVGGLVGNNVGSITVSCSSGAVTGDRSVGGLVGRNARRYLYSLPLDEWGLVDDCYSTGKVVGDKEVGGLVGSNEGGAITASYSTSVVTGNEDVGGLVGSSNEGDITSVFWDTETSGHAESDAGTGLTTAEMQTAATFLETGWDFVGETENGTDEIWWILEGQDYPRLWWELLEEDVTETIEN